MKFWSLVQKIWEGFKQQTNNRLHDQVHLIVTDENFSSGTKSERKSERKKEWKKQWKKERKKEWKNKILNLKVLGYQVLSLMSDFWFHLPKSLALSLIYPGGWISNLHIAIICFIQAYKRPLKKDSVEYSFIILTE